MKSCEHTIEEYSNLYKVFAPDKDAVKIAHDLWGKWSKKNGIPLGIEEAAWKTNEFDHGFFYDIVKMASRMEKKAFPIRYGAFCLNDYNAYAFSATDGYIVLIDDNFFRLLQVFCFVIVAHTQNKIYDKELSYAKECMTKMVIEFYVHKQTSTFRDSSFLLNILERDYESALIANYLARALNAFIISHEIGHHVLGHTYKNTEKKFSMNEQEQIIQVDVHSIHDELDADKYAYMLFHELNHRADADINFAFFQFQFPYAPLFLFDLFEMMESLKTKITGVASLYNTHPSPEARRIALCNEYKIDTSDLFYKDLITALKDLIG